MTFTVEFVAGLANTAVDLMTVDTSNLTAAATTINVSESQVGISDVPATPATNVITFGSGLESGDFSLQHPDINSNTPVDISVNNVIVSLQSITTGENVVVGTAAVYTLTLSSPPSNNYYEILYNNSILLSVDHTGTAITFNGQIYSSIQDAFAAYFGGTWTCTGGPQNPPIVFTGPSETFGTSPWTTQYDYWSYVGVTTTPSFVDGYAGIPQEYVLTLGGTPSSGSLHLLFNGTYIFIIPHDGSSVNLNGQIYASIQDALNQINSGGYGPTGWNVVGQPSNGTTITFIGQQTSIGSSPWSITSDGWNVSVSDNWTDGAEASAGVNAVHSLALEGAFDGTFAINGFTGIPWNIDTDTLSNYWGNNTGQAVTPYISGSGTWDNAWTITYHDPGPVSLPTIDGSYLVGFTNSYLQSQIGSNFIVSGSVANPYTLTSTTNGSGQTEITAINVNMIGATLSNDFTDGTTTPGQNEIQTVTLADSPTGGSWSISYNNDDAVSPLDHNIAEQDLQAALIANWGINTINVSLSGTTYTIDFGVHAPQFGTNTVQADGSGLTKGVTATVTEIRKGQSL